MYDLIIIGGGPAGVAAGVYASRKRLKTLFVTETIGGQSTDSQEIQNWIGTNKISGIELAHSLEEHLRAYATDVLTIQLGEKVSIVTKLDNGFSITTNKGQYTSKTVLVVTGGSRRKLTIPGADQFENKGLTYCASCDGPLFKDQDVAVIGGGNAGFESAAQLLAYCKSVTLIHRHQEFERADAATVETVLAHPNMRVLKSSEPIEILGNMFVKSLVTKNTLTGEKTELPVSGIFVEIGMVPNTFFVKDLVECDEWGRVKVDGKRQKSSIEGIWAAGDCSDALYHQNNIAAGDAIKALEDIYYYLRT